jgi:2',3'-cyclic-nucleotide 2'-phosphodiesterase (5'-nucleotidase family)
MQLVVLHFSDLHNRLGCAGKPAEHATFDRLAGGVRAVQERYAGRPDAAVMVLGGGDDIGGSAFDALLSRDGARPAFHPAYRLLSAIGVDAAVVGNHDLDYGLDTLASWARGEAGFPLLSANLVPICDGSNGACHTAAPPVYPAAMLVIKGLRVGLIGLTTPAEVRPRGSLRFSVANPLPAASHLVGALRPLCDVLIIVSHLGYSVEDPSAAVVVAGDVELARSLPYGSAHLIVGAHTHRALNPFGLEAENIIQQMVIVQAGAHGQYLGETRLTVQTGRNGESVTAVTGTRLTRVAGLPADEAFDREHLRPLAQQVERLYRHRLGTVSLAAVPGEHPVDPLQNAESPLANFVADALVARCRAAGIPLDAAAVDSGLLPGALQLGQELSFGQWYDALPINDTIVLYRLTAGQIYELLIDNARRADRPDEASTERGFLQFSADLRYTILLGRFRQEARAVDILLHERPIDHPGSDARQKYLVAAGSLLRQSAARWKRVAPADIRCGLYDLEMLPSTDTALRVREELASFIEEHGGIMESSGLRRDGRLRVLYGEAVAAAVPQERLSRSITRLNQLVNGQKR